MEIMITVQHLRSGSQWAFFIGSLARCCQDGNVQEEAALGK